MDGQVPASELSGYDNEHLTAEWRRRVANSIGYEGLELSTAATELVGDAEPIIETIEGDNDSL